MSVRAYNVRVPAVLSESPSFNLWHDWDFIDALKEAEGDSEFVNEQIGEGGGTIEFSLSLVERVAPSFFEENDERKALLLEDIKEAKERGDDFLKYECF